MKQVLLTICAIVCLCVTFLSAGVVLCISNAAITQNLSQATALVDTAKFGRDQLVLMADKTRAFCAGEIDKDEIYSTIEQINKEAQTEYKEYEGSDFAAASDEYSLDSNSLSHLEDVKSFFANVRIAFGICLFGSVLFCILLLVMCGRSALGRVLVWSGSIVLILLVVFGVWAIVDFNGMFNWLHSLFFKGGSWFFSEKSLLISMYPTAFWVGMGAICVVSSAVLSAVSLFVGKFVK